MIPTTETESFKHSTMAAAYLLLTAFLCGRVMDSVLESKGKLEDMDVFASSFTQLKNQTSQERYNFNALGLGSSLD